MFAGWIVAPIVLAVLYASKKGKDGKAATIVERVTLDQVETGNAVPLIPISEPRPVRGGGVVVDSGNVPLTPITPVNPVPRAPRATDDLVVRSPGIGVPPLPAGGLIPLEPIETGNAPLPLPVIPPLPVGDLIPLEPIETGDITPSSPTDVIVLDSVETGPEVTVDIGPIEITPPPGKGNESLAAKLYPELKKGPANMSKASKVKLLKQYQEAEGIKVDGYYGPETGESLIAYGFVPPKPWVWPKDNPDAKQDWRALMYSWADRDPQRSDEWEAVA